MTSRESMAYKASLCATAVAGLVCAAPALADGRQSLTKDCEVAVALSALPKRLRDGASVYALVDGKYVKAVTGEGPFTCVVERNDEDALIPQCMDEAGVDTVLPAILDRSRMSLDGASFQELTEAVNKKLEGGDYDAPGRAGISYMMSDYNYIYAPSAERVMKIPPHVMFYAPDLKNTEIGGSFQDMTTNIGTTFIVNEGPHGYMVVYTLYPADANDVAHACEGQLGDAPPRFDPFPKG